MADHKTLAAALIAAQKEFTPVTKDNTANTGKFSYTYADLGSVIEAITPALHNNGLVALQPLDLVDGQPVIRTMLLHTSGEKIESCALVVWADKSDPQKFGGGITYSRRYALMSMLNLNAEDDDAQHARAPGNAPQRPQERVNGQTGEITGRYDAVEEQTNTRRTNTSGGGMTDKQKGLINTLIKQKFGPDRDNAKEWMHSLTGKSSTAELTKQEASTFIDALMKRDDLIDDDSAPF